MRVLQIHNRYSAVGGEDVIADAEAALLSAAGHVVDPMRVDNPSSGRRAATAFAAAAWNPAQARALSRRVQEFRPDIAHIHNTWFVLSGSIFHALHAERVPIVMTLQNYRIFCSNGLLYRDNKICVDCVGSHAWSAVRHRCYRDSRAESAVAALTITANRRRGTYDLVDQFLAPSEFVRDMAVAGGLDRSRITVRPNFVEDPGERPAPPSRSRSVVYAGRLSVEKGLATLLEGWRRAGDATGQLELKIVGDGPLRAQLERDAPPRVSFLGWSRPSELNGLLLTSRSLVMPSQWYENFGRVVIEAMAAGVPVLASDIATPAEVVGQLGPSWLVPPADTHAWATSLSRLVNDALVDDAGTAARGAFLERYGPVPGLASLESVYDQLLTGRNR